jgi:hypothetical protein
MCTCINEMVVGFVDIGGIVDHHYLNFLVISIQEVQN